MELNATADLKAYLIETNEEFRDIAGRHAEYAKRLDDLEAKSHLSYLEEMEETQLKKLKLRLKDQMETLLSQHKAQQVA